MAEQGFCGEESVSGERGACAWVDVGEELVSSGVARVPVLCGEAGVRWLLFSERDQSERRER